MNQTENNVIEILPWDEMLAQMTPGQTQNFHLRHTNTIRYVISMDMSRKYPLFSFKTWVDKKINALVVHRTA